MAAPLVMQNVCDRLSIGYLNKLKTKLTSIKRSEKPVGSQEGSGAEERTEEGSEGNEEGSSPPSDGQDPVAGVAHSTYRIYIHSCYV